jgi:hypothetical protein
MEGKILSIQGRGKPRRRWFQVIKKTLEMTSDEVDLQAKDRDSFRWTVFFFFLIAMFFKVYKSCFLCNVAVFLSSSVLPKSLSLMCVPVGQCFVRTD